MAQIISNAGSGAVDLEKYLEKGPGVSKVKKASAFLPALKALFREDTEGKWGRLPWKKTLEHVRFREGEVTLWAGINGDGKSALLGQAMLGLMAQLETVCIASLEMKAERTLQRMARQASAQEQPSEGWLDIFSAWSDEKLWIYDHTGTVRWPYVVALARYLADVVGIKHFVIDSFTKCGVPSEDYEAQKRFMDELCAVADATGMHIHLVCHMRKGEKYQRTPTKFDVRGAGEIADMAHNLLFVYRNRAKEEKRDDPKLMKEADTFLIVDKQRNHSWEGRIALWYWEKVYRFAEVDFEQPEPMQLGFTQPALEEVDL